MSHGPTNLTGNGVAPTRALLFRLAAGEKVITRNYAPRGGGFKTAHRRGLISARRYGPNRWLHDLTRRGRTKLAEIVPDLMQTPPSPKGDFRK